MFFTSCGNSSASAVVGKSSSRQEVTVVQLFPVELFTQKTHQDGRSVLIPELEDEEEGGELLCHCCGLREWDLGAGFTGAVSGPHPQPASSGTSCVLRAVLARSSCPSLSSSPVTLPVTSICPDHSLMVMALGHTRPLF